MRASFVMVRLEVLVARMIKQDNIVAETSRFGVDPRVKLVLLLVVSITLFVVDRWLGIALIAVAIIACMLVSGVELRRYFAHLVPLYVLLGFTIFFSATSFGLESMGFTWEGVNRGCLYAARILLVVLASLVVSYTTSDTALTTALAQLMAPLRKLHVPVDDIAMTLTLALRFIPVFSEELETLKRAQLSRGAALESGGLIARLRAWTAIMIPLFVGLFRRADQLSEAMDARCYGLSDKPRTSLSARAFTLRNGVILLLGIFLCVAVACASELALFSI